MPRSNIEVRCAAARALSTQRDSWLAISRICGSAAMAPDSMLVVFIIGSGRPSMASSLVTSTS